MTYQIYFLPKGEHDGSRGYTMFDIEYYQVKSDNSETWYSELRSLPIVEGTSRFLDEKLNGSDPDFDFEEFLKDSSEIQELRGLLFEKYDNKPKSKEEAFNFHHKVFRTVLAEKIDSYCEKYGLFLNVD